MGNHTAVAVESNANPAVAHRTLNKELTVREKNELRDTTAWMKLQDDAEIDQVRYEMAHSGGRNYHAGSERFDMNH
jgi:hypothetical protein